MRPTLLATVLVLIIAHLGPAGNYNPAKPALDVPKDALPFDYFRDRIADLIMIGDSSRETKPRKAALDARAALQRLTDPTPNQLVERGLLSLRLRDTEAAFSDLHLATRLDRESFWALSALGTLYEQAGQY